MGSTCYQVEKRYRFHEQAVFAYLHAMLGPRPLNVDLAPVPSAGRTLAHLPAQPVLYCLAFARFTLPADCFKGLDQLVKNYLASVPLVGDLRSPAMRPRHWDALQEATKVGAACTGSRAVLCVLS